MLSKDLEVNTPKINTVLNKIIFAYSIKNKESCTNILSFSISNLYLLNHNTRDENKNLILSICHHQSDCLLKIFETCNIQMMLFERVDFTVFYSLVKYKNMKLQIETNACLVRSLICNYVYFP